MKIIGFEDAGRHKLGVVEGDRVLDAQAADPGIGDLTALLARSNGDLSPLQDLVRLAPASAWRSLEGVKYGLPIVRPGKVVCLGLNYLDHVKEGPSRDNVPKFPTIFMRVNTSLVPHLAPLVRPRVSVTFDYEAEMAVVIGRRARHLTLQNAASCIAGYCCFNDGSIREFQRRTPQWDMGKNFDGTGGFGPWMITADELPPAGKGLKIQSRLNGKVMQSDNTNNMMFPVVETLVDLTQAMTLEPGDIVVTGTPSGVGAARNPPVWMKAGDVCEIEVEGIGILRNPVEDETS